MDKALKQRLVGASVLVALAVIILPMLLGGQADRAQESREIEIPPRPAELSFEKRRFPIGEQAPDTPSTVPEQARQDTELVTGDASEVVEIEAPPRSLQERLEAVAAANEVAVGEVQEQIIEETPDETVETPPAPDPALSAAQTAPLVEAPAQESFPPPDDPPAMETEAAAAGGRYLVQVASFSSTGNANRLAASLRETGLPVLMDTVESAAGTLNRVRVGPFAQRAEADQVLARLANQIPDVRPRLVDLRPDEESRVTEPDDPLVRWVVQMGVFSGSDNADKLVFDLRDAGYRAVSRAETVEGTTRYRVMVGPEVNRAAAVTLADRLQAEMGIKGIVQSTE